MNNNLDRVTRVYKLQLKYRDCFLQVLMAFHDAEFTLKLRTIGNSWEEATRASKSISTVFGLYGLLKPPLARCCQHQKLSSKKHKSVPVRIKICSTSILSFPTIAAISTTPPCNNRLSNHSNWIRSNFLICVANTILKSFPWVKHNIAYSNSWHWHPLFISRNKVNIYFPLYRVINNYTQKYLGSISGFIVNKFTTKDTEVLVIRTKA